MNKKVREKYIRTVRVASWPGHLIAKLEQAKSLLAVCAFRNGTFSDVPSEMEHAGRCKNSSLTRSRNLHPNAVTICASNFFNCPCAKLAGVLY